MFELSVGQAKWACSGTFGTGVSELASLPARVCFRSPRQCDENELAPRQQRWPGKRPVIYAQRC